MHQVFEKNELAGIKLNNRIIRSATGEAMADDKGRPSSKLAELYLQLAKGGLGAIVTGCISVHPKGIISKTAPMLHTDESIYDFKALVEPVKAYGTPMIAQLIHAGARINPAATGTEPVGPSPKRYPKFGSEARELTDNEIQEIIEAFVNAIIRAKQSGFDGIQLHAAHGYLLSAFLSPFVNQRNDRWGGNTENRFRIVNEIIRSARQKVGEYPIFAKYSAYDNDKNGVSVQEGIKIAQLFGKAGVDAVEISSGSAEDGFIGMRIAKKSTEVLRRFTTLFENRTSIGKVAYEAMIPAILDEEFNPSPLHCYSVEVAQKIKSQISIPVIAVGGIRKIQEIQNIIMEDKADYVSMSRPLIREPDLVNKFYTGKQEKAKCIDCGLCLFGLFDNVPLRCYQNKT